MKITAIVDNRAEEGFCFQHGLSLWIETGESKILFDSGASWEALRDNSEKLGIDPASADFSVLSHAHYDHAGGYTELLKTRKVKRFVTGPGFFTEKYCYEPWGERYIGASISRALVAESGAEHLVADGCLELAHGVWAVGRFGSYYDFEAPLDKFFVKERGGNRKDLFEDEIALVLDCPLGLVLVAGCSHPGILNMIRTVRERFGRDLAAVVGGPHLMESSEERIRQTIGALKTAGVRRVGLMHCAGDLAVAMLADDSAIDSFYLKAGDAMVF